jgi:hypothetical protein
VARSVTKLLAPDSTVPGPARVSTSIRSLVFACSVLFAAFVVRVIDLGSQSLWWDEAYSALLAAQGPRAILRELRDFDFHPPAHYLLEWLWMPIAGQTELALRFPSLVAGLLTVAVGARLGGRLFGPKGAITAGLTFAFSPFLVYYSQEARMYAAAALLSVLALYSLHRAIERDEWRWWIAFAAASVAGLYTFYYTIFIPMFGGVYALLAPSRSRRRVVRLIGAGALTVAAYGPWLPVLLRRNAVWDSQWATTSSPLKVIGWTWQTLSLGIADPKLASDMLAVGLMAALALIVAAALVLNGPARLGSTLFALGAFALPLALIAAIAAVKPVFHPRYAVAAAPGLALAIAGLATGLWLPGSGALSLARRYASAAVALVVLGCVTYGGVVLRANPGYSRDDYRASVGYLEQRLGPRDVIIYNAHPGFTFYYRGTASAGYFPPAPYEEDRIDDALTEISQGHDRIWYFRHAEVPNDPEGFVEQGLERATTKCDERWFGAIRVTCYAIRPDASFASVELAATHINLANRLLLTGYSLSSQEAPTAGAVEIRLRWQVLAPLEDSGVWVGLQDDAGRMWGREDRQPRNSRLQLASGWKAGEVVTTRHRLPVLLGTPPGRYRVVVGVYRLADVRALDVLDELGRPHGQTLQLAPVTITRATTSATGDPTLPGPGAGQLAPGIELAGYQVDAVRASPGGRLGVTLLWRAVSAQPGDVDVVVRMTPSVGGAPLAVARERLGDSLPPSQWRLGEMLREQREVRLPSTAPAGSTRLELGLAPPGAEPRTFAPLGEVTLASVARTYDAPKPARRIDLDLADAGAPVIRLVGTSSLPDSIRSGEKLKVTLYLQALGDVSTRYRVFVHVTNPSGEVKAQRDGEPKDWTRPTDTWLKGEVLEDTYEVEIGSDVTQGDYSVRVGLYEPQSGIRLVAGSADYVTIGSVTVRP